MLSKYITNINFEPDQGFNVRNSLTFSDSDKIRLDNEDYNIKLKLDSSYKYPTDSDINIRTKLYNPESIHKLLFIEVKSNIPIDEDKNELGSVKLRIYDGTNELYWDGGAWSVAGVSDWNTEDEINQNIQSFDVTDRKFSFVINLQTIDDRYTPSIEYILVLWEGEIDWHEDILINSLTKMIQDECFYYEDISLPPVDSDVSSIDLDDYTDESELNISDIDAVYDHSSDPNHRSDLLDSYDSGTNVISLNSTILTGNIPYIRLKVKPQVAWDTQQDFTEVGKLPQIVLMDTDSNSVNCPIVNDSGIVRKDSGEGIELKSPYRMNFLVNMEIRVDRTRTQARLLDSVISLLTNGPSSEEGPFLRSVATDERYRIWLTDELISSNKIDNYSDIRSFKLQFRIVNVQLFLKPAINTFMVQKFNLGFYNTDSESEQKAIINDEPVPKTDIENFEIT